MTVFKRVLFNTAINQNRLTQDTLWALSVDFDLDKEDQKELWQLITEAHKQCRECESLLRAFFKKANERQALNGKGGEG